MAISALQNNDPYSLANIASFSGIPTANGMGGVTGQTSSSDSISISDQARQLFAQSYGQFNGLTTSSATSDAEDGLLQSVAQGYTLKGGTEPAADAGSLPATAQSAAAQSGEAVTPASEDAGSAGARGGQGGGGQGGESDDDDSDEESIRQQISSLRARVSMLSSAISGGDSTAYSQLASLEAEISALTASLSA